MWKNLDGAAFSLQYAFNRGMQQVQRDKEMNLEQSVKETWGLVRSLIADLPAYEDATETQRKLANTFYAAGFYAAGGSAKRDG